MDNNKRLTASPSPRIVYPVSENVRRALRDYPKIAEALKLSLDHNSSLEIVRILDNLHYPHLKRLAELIDSLLPLAGPIGRRVLRAADLFQVDQALAELFLFAWLHAIYGERVHAVDLGPSEKGPDLEVQCPGFIAKLEVYTPVELHSYQLFERYVQTLLKYADVPFGFEVDAELVDTENNLYYPYRFSAKIPTWLPEFTEQVVGWLSGASVDSSFFQPVLATGTKLRICMVQVFDHPSRRDIRFSSPTRSNDSRLFFEVGTAEDTARTEWGRKLKQKLLKKQCGDPDDHVLRILVVNFALADTGFPGFICGRRFSERFDVTVHCLVPSGHPYDLVVPGNLQMNPWFGDAVMLNLGMETTAKLFVRESWLDQRAGHRHIPIVLES